MDRDRDLHGWELSLHMDELNASELSYESVRNFLKYAKTVTEYSVHFLGQNSMKHRLPQVGGEFSDGLYYIFNRTTHLDRETFHTVYQHSMESIQLLKPRDLSESLKLMSRFNFIFILASYTLFDERFASLSENENKLMARFYQKLELKTYRHKRAVSSSRVHPTDLV